MSSSELKPSASASDAASDKPVDYYTLLGLGKDASKTDIEKAYVQLAWKWHPQKNRAYQLEANAMFKRIAEAYEILSDGDIRRLYDASLTDGTQFTADGFDFADPYDMFDNFKSFPDMKMGDDDVRIDSSSASEDGDEEDAMSIGSGIGYSSADDRDWQINSAAFSVTRRTTGETIKVEVDSTATASGSDAEAEPTAASVSKDGDDNEDKEDGGSESLGAKTVHLSTETRPNGRTYMTKKLSENGVETLNVVREGGIEYTDIADAVRFVNW